MLMVLPVTIPILGFKRDENKGFTLIELFIVIVIIGIVATIAVPTWLRFLARHQVSTVGSQLHQGVQQAQMKSGQKSSSWQLSVRERSGTLEMIVHSSNTLPGDSGWSVLDSSVQLDEETTFATSGDLYLVRFDEKGNVRYRLGRLTVSSKRFPDIKCCVIVSTLIGATRTANERTEPDPSYRTRDRFCY